MEADEFNGRRLRLARSYAGVTQVDLAERIEAAQSWVQQLEAGSRKPTREMVAALAEATGFLPAFFLGPLTNEFTEEHCHFRKRKTSSAGAKHHALATGTLFAQVVAFLEDEIDFPEDRVPSLVRARAEDAASRCRLAWGLTADRPIGSMTRAVETAGVLVTRCRSSDKVDAFSCGVAGRKVIIVNDRKGATRTRFDIAHELAHLVLHSGAVPTGADVEAEADIFASAFLMPVAGFAHEFPRTDRIDWTALVRLKQRWGASLQAMLRRARDLGRISALQYTSACKHISWNGWTKEEPAEPAVERPEALARAFQLLAEEEDPVERIGAATGISEPVLLEVIGGAWTPPIKAAPPPAPAPINLAEARARRGPANGNDA